MNSWRFGFQVVAGTAGGYLACDGGYPANDSVLRGGVELKRGDQEDHSVASSWTSGGEGS